MEVVTIFISEVAAMDDNQLGLLMANIIAL